MILNSCIMCKIQEDDSTAVGTDNIRSLCEEFQLQIAKVKLLVREEDSSILEPPVIGTQDEEIKKQQLAGWLNYLLTRK